MLIKSEIPDKLNLVSLVSALYDSELKCRKVLSLAGVPLVESA